jgi:hypothetical protein
MDNERYQIVRVEGYGLGVIREQHAHYAVVEFKQAGHVWTVVVDNDDYEVAEEITLGYEEIT